MEAKRPVPTGCRSVAPVHRWDLVRFSACHRVSIRTTEKRRTGCGLKSLIGAMPQPGRRQVLPQQLAALITYLQQDERSQEEDALQEHAASAGMAGPAPSVRGC
jgi:hypothetical protein